MSNLLSYQSLNKHARITGFLYLIIIVCGMSSEMLVRTRLINWDDAGATVTNIMTHPMLFRLGFVSDFIMVICDVVVAVMFYVLLKHINNTLALLAAFFRLVQSTILGFNLLNFLQPVLLLEGYNEGLKHEYINAQVMQFLHAHNYGYLIALVFFALSCMVLGYLIIKSTLFPGLLGILLIIAACGYLIDSFTNFLIPQYASVTEYIVVVSALVAEIGLCLWLLIKGVQKNVVD